MKIPNPADSFRLGCLYITVLARVLVKIIESAEKTLIHLDFHLSKQ